MKILVADKVNDAAIKLLKKDGHEVDIKTGLSEDDIVSIIPEYDAMIVRSGVKVTKKIIDAAEKLKIIGRAGVGVDNIDVEAATAKGILVMNTPFGNVNSAAEHTIAMIMSLARHVHHGHHSLKHKKEWERKKYTGVELKGKKLGIIGLGKVGGIVAKIAKKGLGMKLLGYDPVVDAAGAKKMGVKKVEFEELIKKSDFITVHVPLIEQTKNLIDKKEFDIMKKGVRIINVARGGVINEQALHDAIKEGKVEGAAIDVWTTEPPFDNPLLNLDNVLVTPHLGASTVEAQENVAIDISKQFIEAFKNGVIVNAVNKLEKLR